MSIMTKERLSTYIPLEIEVRDQLERLARMRSAETIPPMRDATGGGSGGGTGDSLERKIISRLEYQDKITPAVTAALDELDAIRSAIDGLQDPLFRAVLRLRYTDAVDGKPREWKDIALRIYSKDEERHIKAAQRLHDRAIDVLEAKTE